MPHFGLMDATKMTEVDATLLRARLHLRGARRRFEIGKYVAGIAALYDALSYAMQWYIILPEHREQLDVEGADLTHDKDLFAVLSHGGVLDDSFDFDSFEQLTMQAMDDSSIRFDAPNVLAQAEQVMTLLGVLPFDEAALPPENPAGI
jgi:hypothetical protein